MTEETMHYLIGIYDSIKFNRFVNMQLANQKLNKKKIIGDRESSGEIDKAGLEM